MSIPRTDAGTPIRVAIVNDYEVVVRGLHRVLAPHAERIRVVELDSALPVSRPVDVALYDTFGLERVDRAGLLPLLKNGNVARLAVYTWLLDEDVVASAHTQGAAAVIPKSLTGDELAAAIEAVHRGEALRWDPPAAVVEEAGNGDWPGRAEGLTPRQSEMVALIAQGLSNKEIGDRTRLSANTIKSYIRSAYWQMGVTTRSQAVLWALDHGFREEAQPMRVVLEPTA